MNPIWLLALVPPLAFACGWWLARRSHVRGSGQRVNELSSDYFRGLNYLLNEEQDKALEVFLRLAEYNRDTVETHLALGNLFRKRGEVDRAIRLHQHLVSRQGLSDEMKTVALLELGEDYMRAGLLDRAETLFSDLVAMDALAPSALRHLIAIYQHEREWHKAIDHARRLETMTGEDESAMIAQFYCELAEQSRQHGARTEARDYVREAFACQQDCVRAHMIAGRLSAEDEELDQAIASYEAAIAADIAFVPEILPPLLNCYARSQQMDRAEAFLPNGGAPAVGDIFVQRNLAETLRSIAKHGAKGFYEGPVAADIVATLRALGGLHTEADLAAGRTAAEFVEPIHARWNGYDVWQCPPNGQGLLVLMILGMLGGALSFAWTPREPLAASGGGEPATVDSAERADQSGDTDTDSTQAIPRQFPPSDGGNSARHGVGSSW